MYAGCVAGAIQKQVYLELIEANGFKNITVQKDKAIIIPDDILSKYLISRTNCGIQTIRNRYQKHYGLCRKTSRRKSSLLWS